MALNPRQFQDIPPPEFGTQPIPEGHLRLNHYTTEEGAEGIRQHGLVHQFAVDSFARGGTEYPQNFATAGRPSDDMMRRNPIVELHADPVKDLDTNSLLPVQNTAGNRAAMEKRNSTVTFHGDLPASNVVAVHQPWHSAFRYLQGNPNMEHSIMHGEYDDTGDPDTDRAVRATKVMLAAKVMAGGQLGRYRR